MKTTHESREQMKERVVKIVADMKAPSGTQEAASIYRLAEMVEILLDDLYEVLDGPPPMPIALTPDKDAA